MNNYNFKATGLIADYFKEHNVNFLYASDDNMNKEILLVGSSVDDGPDIFLQYFIGEDNDVAVHTHSFISATTPEKQLRLLQVCNSLNNKIRHMKFCLNTQGGVNVEYDFPVSTSDDCVGEGAFELLIRITQALDTRFEEFATALYTEEDIINREKKELSELLALKKLMELNDGLEENEIVDVLSDEEGNEEVSSDALLELLEETFNSDGVNSSEED